MSAARRDGAAQHDGERPGGGAAMISEAKLAANRANAQKSTGPRTVCGKLRSAQNPRKSTGPRTAAGKARSAQNARRHGLTHSALGAPEFAQAVAGLAHAVAKGSKDPQVLALAIQFAVAQVDIVRARRARVDLLAAHPFDNIRRAAATDWYEQNARTRRKAAIRALADALAGSSPPAAISRNHPDGSSQMAFCENELNPTQETGDFLKTN